MGSTLGFKPPLRNPSKNSRIRIIPGMWQEQGATQETSWYELFSQIPIGQPAPPDKEEELQQQLGQSMATRPQSTQVVTPPQVQVRPSLKLGSPLDSWLELGQFLQKPVLKKVIVGGVACAKQTKIMTHPHRIKLPCKKESQNLETRGRSMVRHWVAINHHMKG